MLLVQLYIFSDHAILLFNHELYNLPCNSKPVFTVHCIVTTMPGSKIKF